MTAARVARIAAVVICAGAITAGCSLFGNSATESTTGEASTPATPSSTTAVTVITPHEANSRIVPKKDVSQLVGSDLDYEKRSSNPGSLSIEGKQACRSLMVPLTIDIGDSWTTYRDVWYQESENSYTHAVDQRVLLYPARDAALAAYGKGFPADIRSCSGEVLKSKTAAWRETVREVTENRLQWAEEQVLDDKPVGWRCIKEVRIEDNLLFSAAVCQRGNGAPALKAIMDRTAAAKPK